MTRSLSDLIEKYIKDLLDQNEEDVVDIQRNVLAGELGCAPSQINYVLGTRFPPERGYIVESRRGGGGFIRIIRLPISTKDRVLQMLTVNALSEDAAMHRVDWLEENGWLTSREAALMRAAMLRSVLKVGLPERDQLRAALFRAMLSTVLTFTG